MQTLIDVERLSATSSKMILSLLLATGVVGNIAYAESVAVPKSPAVNSVVNPDAEDDPNDPILPVFEKADEVMDTIIVRGDRWVNPSNTDLRNLLDRSPNGYGVTDVRLSEMAREEKLRICGNIARVFSFYQCSAVAGGPPTDASSMPFDYLSYGSYLAWQDIALQFARDVYDAKYPGPNGNFDAATIAYRGSLERCNPIVACVRDVQRFFGLSSVSRTGINGSDAGKVVSKFGNAFVCSLVTQQQNRFRCSSGT
jgi:hypothetical protein